MSVALDCVGRVILFVEVFFVTMNQLLQSQSLSKISLGYTTLVVVAAACITIIYKVRKNSLLAYISANNESCLHVPTYLIFAASSRFLALCLSPAT